MSPYGNNAKRLRHYAVLRLPVPGRQLIFRVEYDPQVRRGDRVEHPSPPLRRGQHVVGHTLDADDYSELLRLSYQFANALDGRAGSASLLAFSGCDDQLEFREHISVATTLQS